MRPLLRDVNKGSVFARERFEEKENNQKKRKKELRDSQQVNDQCMTEVSYSFSPLGTLNVAVMEVE